MSLTERELAKQLAALAGPWPPGCDYRTTVVDDQLYVLLRPDAPTPPPFYLAHWSERCSRENMLCLS